MELGVNQNMISHFSHPQIGATDAQLGQSRTFVSGAFVSAKNLKKTRGEKKKLQDKRNNYSRFVKEVHWPQVTSIGGYSCRPINGNSSPSPPSKRGMIFSSVFRLKQRHVNDAQLRSSSRQPR